MKPVDILPGKHTHSFVPNPLRATDLDFRVYGSPSWEQVTLPFCVPSSACPALKISANRLAYHTYTFLLAPQDCLTLGKCHLRREGMILL